MLSLSVLKFHTGRNSLQQGGWPSVPRGPWAPPHHSRCPPQTSAMFWTGDTTTATPHTSGPRPPLPHPLQIQDHINVNTSHDICHCCPIFIRGGCDLQYREELGSWCQHGSIVNMDDGYSGRGLGGTEGSVEGVSHCNIYGLGTRSLT